MCGTEGYIITRNGAHPRNHYLKKSPLQIGGIDTGVVYLYLAIQAQILIAIFYFPY